MATVTHTGPCRDTGKHGQEVDLHGRYSGSQKHSDDPRFFPVDQFCKDHLPSRYQSAHLVDYVQAFANLVVSIAVNCVSEARPEHSRGSDKLYPCHNMKGSEMKREGTGFISSIYVCPDIHIPEFVTCECPECLDSSSPKTQFAHIAIRTATHLVFDDKEASKVVCKIFDKDSSVNGNVIELSGMRRVTSRVHCDWCVMLYVTHDMDLVNRIKKLVTHRDHLKDILVTQCLLSMPRDEKEENNGKTRQGKLNITISHSNEYNKQVSFVEYEHVNETKAHSHNHINASMACLGSCGAPVMVIEKDWRLSGFEHTHSGHYEADINYSGHGIGFTPFNHQHAGDKKHLDSKSCDHKTTEECWIQENGKAHEVDLHKNVVCPKNPGHPDFIPAAEFNMENLPPGFQNRNEMDCIQALKSLTVRVSVTYTSENRPATFSFSDKPYTGNEYKGTESMRTGTGIVQNITRHPNKYSKGNETCPCKKCLSSRAPETQFAYVTVHSAAHVVFDDLEGEHTICDLFFDKGNTSDLCDGAVKLEGASCVWCDVYKDTCKMVFVTHDVPLIDKLCEMVSHWQCLQQKLEHQCITSSSKDKSAPSDGNNEIDSKPQPTVIVSHPHGCCKHVTIGSCVSMNAKGNGYTECYYTTPTCPGSSGAYVFVVGKFWKCWAKHHYGV